MYRTANIQDASKLDKLLTKLIDDERQYDPSVEHINVRDFYINYIEDDTKYIFLYEEDNNIVGYIYLIKDNDHIKIDALYVEELYRNKKVATTLLNEAIDYAKVNNIKYITVNVLENNIKAKSLYRKYFKLNKKDGIKEELILYL